MFFSGIKFVRKQSLTTIIVALAILITFTTSGVAAFKIVKSISSEASKKVLASATSNKDIADNQALDKNDVTKGINISLKPSISPTPSITKSTSAKINFIAPVVKPTLTNNQIAQSAPSNGCIITLFGQQYDVTNLRKTHSGGDVFKCGTDMTSVYQGRHGSNVSMMQQYLITGGNNSPNTQAVQTTQPTPALVANTTPQVTQTVASSACIITLFGKQYDVTNLRKTHSGGDVFKCGTDMTSVYQNRHGTSVAMMQQYLVAQGNTTTTQVTQPPPAPSTQPSGNHRRNGGNDD